MRHEELNNLLKGICEGVFGDDLVDSYKDYEVGQEVYVKDLPDGCYEFADVPERLKGTKATISLIDNEDESILAEFHTGESSWFSMLEIEIINKKRRSDYYEKTY